MFLDVSGCFWMFLDVSGCFWMFLDVSVLYSSPERLISLNLGSFSALEHSELLGSLRHCRWLHQTSPIRAAKWYFAGGRWGKYRIHSSLRMFTVYHSLSRFHTRNAVSAFSTQNSMPCLFEVAFHVRGVH